MNKNRSTLLTGIIVGSTLLIVVALLFAEYGFKLFPSAPSSTPTFTFTPSVTPTITLTPTNTLTPTITFTPSPTSIAPPPGYRIIDDFAQGEDNDAIFEKHFPSTCTINQQDGLFKFQCNRISERDTYLRFIPRDNSNFRGIAMLGHTEKPFNETWGRITIMVGVLPSGDPNERAYTIALRKGQITVVEYYPSENWRFEVLVKQNIPLEEQSHMHSVQIEFSSQGIEFYFDGKPIILENQPNLPEGYYPDHWQFEAVLFKGSSNEILDAQIDWFAVK